MVLWGLGTFLGNLITSTDCDQLFGPERKEKKLGPMGRGNTGFKYDSSIGVLPTTAKATRHRVGDVLPQI